MPAEKPKGMPDEVWHHVQKLKNKYSGVREDAVRELGKIKHESAVPALAQALKDKHSSVRGNAAWALGEIKHESSIPHLIQALKDGDVYVRSSAVEALGGMGESLEKKQEQGEELTPEGEKLLKAISLVKPHFQPKESEDVKVRVLHAALTGEIDKKNARLYIKQLRAMK